MICVRGLVCVCNVLFFLLLLGTRDDVGCVSDGCASVLLIDLLFQLIYLLIYGVVFYWCRYYQYYR